MRRTNASGSKGKPMEERVYLLWDGRAADGSGTEYANCLEHCLSDAEACKAKGDYGAMACYSYRENDGELTDERFEWNWFPE